MKKPRVLLIDIETAPILGYVWRLFDQNIALNQIHSDWHLLSFSAKWLDEPADKIMYFDQRKARNIENDKPLLKKLWKLMDQSDIIISQNGIAFDVKKINARFVQNGFQPPSSFRQIDTLKIAKKHFAFTSNKLEYLSGQLCTKYKKLTHKKFPGFELWKACLAGNVEAWNEMEEYNKHDVLALEELYHKLKPWDGSINFDVYREGKPLECECGGTSFRNKGYHYTDTNKFNRWKCRQCGHETKSKVGLIKRGTIQRTPVKR